ncbi:hypothetical protein DSECCO2_210220 [anaerobic digester metagenome]
MMYIPSLISFLIFVVISIFLVLSSLFNALAVGSYLFAAVLLVVLIGLISGHHREYQLILEEDKERLKKASFQLFDLFVILSTLGGTLLTFFLNNHLQLGGVVASAMVGLLGPLLAPKLQRAIFCGSFAGMATSMIFTNIWWVGLAGFLSGLLLAASREIYDGFGGKLGAAGFFGTITTALLSDRFIYNNQLGDLNRDYNLVFYFILGAVFTYHVNKINRTGTILASSGVGLIAGLVLPRLYGPVGASYAVAAFCGSFVGMTILDRLSNEFYLYVASLFGGVIFLYTQINFVGLGGKLGTTAFASVVAWWGLLFLYDQAIDPGTGARRRRQKNKSLNPSA